MGRLTNQQVAALESEGDALWEEVAERFATGTTVRELMRWLGSRLKLGRNLSSGALYNWRDKTDERRASWQHAKEYRADHLAEEGLEIVDEAEGGDADQQQSARLRSDYRRWLAGVSNPEKYQPKVAGSTTVNIGALFLEATRGAGRAHVLPSEEVALSPSRLEGLESLPAEVVEETEYTTPQTALPHKVNDMPARGTPDLSSLLD